MRMRSRAVLIAAAALGMGVQAAQAQQPATSRWEFSASPYLWIAGITGSASTPSGRTPEPTVSASFGDIVSSLSGLAIMGAAEARYGRFGIAADIVSLTIERDFATPRNILFHGGEARIGSTFVTLAGFYRLAEAPSHFVDVGAGVRPWWLSTRLRLNPGLDPGRTVNSSLDWVDPVVAARTHLRLSDTWGLSAFGDFGGFGVGSRFTWQAGATLDWRPAEWIDLRAGWRHLAVEIEQSQVTLKTSISGPIIGATMRF
jgi:hypothetical protein